MTLPDIPLLRSPLEGSFQSFIHCIKQHVFLVSPFITKDPLQRLAKRMAAVAQPRIEILTSLAIESLIQGSTDVRAIAEFYRAIPSTSVVHLSNLHAKVYVADGQVAIITSANLTTGGLRENYEYEI